MLEHDLAIGRAAERFDGSGARTDAETSQRLAEILEALTQARRQLAKAA